MHRCRCKDGDQRQDVQVSFGVPARSFCCIDVDARTEINVRMCKYRLICQRVLVVVKCVFFGFSFAVAQQSNTSDCTL